MQRVVLILASVMLFCLGILLSLLATTASEVASAPVSAEAGYVHGIVLVPLAEDGSHLLTPADEAQEQDKRPVNASELTMLVLVITSLFEASTLCLLMRNRTHGDPSFLGVFLL